MDQFGRYMPDYYTPARPMSPRYELIKVNGRGGAEAFQMAPNSEVLLLDASAPLVWLKTTDGAGYATCTPYSITPYTPEPQANVADLVARIERLEGLINDKPDNSGNKRGRPSAAE